MTAINRKMVSIAIVDAATDGSDLASTDYITGEIKTYSKSGGDKDVESVPHFGGDVDKEKPRAQFELNFEVTPSIDDAAKWEALAYGSAVIGSNTVYLSNADAGEKAVFIQAVNSTDYITWAFDNCSVTVLEMEHDAEDNMSKTLNLKFSSENSSGRANFMAVKVAASALPSWTALPNGS